MEIFPEASKVENCKIYTLLCQKWFGQIYHLSFSMYSAHVKKIKRMKQALGLIVQSHILHGGRY